MMKALLSMLSWLWPVAVARREQRVVASLPANGPLVTYTRVSLAGVLEVLLWYPPGGVFVRFGPQKYYPTLMIDLPNGPRYFYHVEHFETFFPHKETGAALHEATRLMVAYNVSLQKAFELAGQGQ